MMDKILSVHELMKIVSKTINFDENASKIIDYQFNSDNDSFGYIGEFSRLTIRIGRVDDEQYNENVNLFIKSIPYDNNGEIQNSELNMMFEREAFMYSEILLKFYGNEHQWLNADTKWMPKCYLARKDLLVLEDLNLKGLKHLKHRTRLEGQLMECVLRNVAKMHAESISYDTKIYPKTVGDLFGNYIKEFVITKEELWFQMGLDTLKALIPLTPNFHRYQQKFSNELFDELIFPIYDMVEPSRKYRNVFCHQDLWTGNIMFKFAEINGKDDLSKPLDCVLIDYQFARYLPPAVDVLMLIFTTTRVNNRRKGLWNYLKYYYECLCKEVEKKGLVADEILSWKDFESSCEELKLFPLVFNCVGLPFTYFTNEIQMQIKSCSSELFKHFRDVNRHDFIIQYMKEDEDFKDVVLESIEELMETLFV